MKDSIKKDLVIKFIESLQDLVDDEVPYDLVIKELIRFKKAIREDGN